MVGKKEFLSTPSARRATPDRYDASDDTHQFLSTPSARRATANDIEMEQIRRNFYPRPPRGGRREQQHYRASNKTISIHALREEGDLVTRVKVIGLGKFLSTPSARRATMVLAAAVCSVSISIHALREEGDA